MTSPTTSVAPASKSPPMNLRGSRPCILLCMNRRFLTLTVTISLDDDLCNAADVPSRESPGTYQDAIDAVRATVAHDVAAQLAPLDPGVAQVTVTYDGVIQLGVFAPLGYVIITEAWEDMPLGMLIQRSPDGAVYKPGTTIMIPADKYLDARGQALSTNAALFAVIGYTYGGEGNEFHLPDLRGRVSL